MTTDAPQRPRRPVVLTELPRCPDCDSKRHHAYAGTHWLNDGYGERRVQYLECDQCGTRFKSIAD